jgi:ABC-type transport system involved in multi-copper enzyme maturation permease subunit
MLITALLYTIFMMFSFQGVGGAMFITSVTAVTYLFIMTACAYDDKNKSDIMLNSLPIGRKKVVLSRYISIFAFALVAIAIYIIMAGVIKLASLPIKVRATTIEDVCGSIASLVIITSVYLPVFFKVGYIKSKILNFVLFFSMFFGVSMLAGFIKEHKISSTAVVNFVQFLERQSDITITSVLMVIMLIILLISYSLSVKFYKNREF